MSGITVGQAGEVLVAVKQASDPDHRARLRHEADLLGRLDHPGVVRLIDFQEGPPAALRTAFVGPDSWRTSTVSAAGFAALTSTVADLHDAGLAHGDLRTDHVLVDADHRPILCGFAQAGPATPERMQADRTALATMLRDHAAANSGGTSRLRDAANALDEPALPTRAAIRLLDDQTPVPTPNRQRWPRSNRAKVAAIASTVMFAGVAIAITSLGPGDSVSADEPAPSAAAAQAPDQSSEPTPRSTSPSPEQPSPEQPSPAEPVVEPENGAGDVAGTTLVHDGRRFAVGSAGDIVEVADWACSGTATPAVLRPATGDVVVFTEWPAPGAELMPTVAVVVDGALGFTIPDTECPDLRVRTATGSQLIEVPT
ncbi:MAG: hypothetical protein AAGA37_13060 [Actinomycetota bacterium]